MIEKKLGPFMGQLVCGYPQKGYGSCVAARVVSGLEKSMKNPSVGHSE